MHKHFFATDIIIIIFIFQGLITMHCEWITIQIKHTEEKKICITIDQQKKDWHDNQESMATYIGFSVECF